MPKIVILSGENIGDWYELSDIPMVFGRDESLLAELNDCFVSFRHAKIRLDPTDNDFYIRDLQSRNGIIINGQRVEKFKRLQDKDLIQLGYTLMTFTEEPLDEYRAVERFVARTRRRCMPLIEQLNLKRDKLLKDLNHGTHAQNAITIQGAPSTN
ncbi:FHA domain-containing protein [Planctomycetota bacterium]|nr:FHA domain-containing protein [Planctomycetota bacterium]